MGELWWGWEEEVSGRAVLSWEGAVWDGLGETGRHEVWLYRW